ncbi:hypothetical protein BgiMline_011665 [Biomphalaria glabrata]|nr:hypothetical protein BgiMline_029138 [Biomphalaria glabrata]
MTPSKVILFYVGLNLEIHSLALSTTSSYLKVAYGYKITVGTPLSSFTSTAMTSVVCALRCWNDCNSATYSRKYQTCLTFQEKFYYPGLDWTVDEEWCMLYRDESSLQYGDWRLVFKARSGTNSSFYDLWEKDGHHDDGPLSSDLAMGCYRWDKKETCTRHFRSSVLDNWTNIDKVRFSLIANVSEVVSIVFNGTSTTRQSWYDRRLILESSWSLLKNDSQAVNFNFQGYTSENDSRRLTIFATYSGCNNDRMYFSAFDSAYESCGTTWMPIPSYPLFIYSPQNQMVKVSTKPPEFSVADILSVFVQQKQP